MTLKPRPTILCVDDEPRILEGLALNLRRHYEVHVATGGAEALDAFGRLTSVAVVLSDMRMPGMDGAALLAELRGRSPDTVRMLLTGETDVQKAAEAVNEGQVFRFLLKPCPPDQVLRAFAAACEQHHLLTAQRVLVEQTLHGSIRALTEVLALANPTAFGRAVRLQSLVKNVADRMQIAERWAVEVAAMLSQIGWVTVSPETAQRFYQGEELTQAEREIVETIPHTAQKLLQHIPRLESVFEILAAQNGPGGQPVGSGSSASVGARILKAAIGFDTLEMEGVAAAVALDTMRGRTGAYDATVLQALADSLNNTRAKLEIREVPLSALHVGMVLAQDVRLRSGVLLVTRGFEVSAGLIARLRNYPAGSIREPLRVSLASQKESTG